MRAATLLLCLVALIGGGCGGGDENETEEYVKRYRPLNEKLIEISQKISATLSGGQSGQPLGLEFDLQIAQLETVNRNIANLDTPEELRDESRTLTARISRTVAKLKQISTAVREGRQEEAASATVELAARAQAVNRAQDQLARATRAKPR